MLECRNAGMMECRNGGILKHGTPEYLNTERRNTKTSNQSKSSPDED